MKVATMTTAELEARLGPRGPFRTTKDNRWDVRKWLTAHGLKSDFVNRLSYERLSTVYNDVSNAALDALRIAEGNGFAQAAQEGAVFEQDEPNFALEPTRENVPPAISKPTYVQTAPDVATIAEMLAKLFAQQNRPSLDVDAVRQIVKDEVHGLKPRPIQVTVNEGPAVMI